MSDGRARRSRLERLFDRAQSVVAQQEIGKHWKLVCCATAINALLASPVYLYGLTDTNHHHISPPIIFNGLHLVASPWIYGDRLKRLQQTNSRIVNCCLIAIIVITIFTGISISGLFLSPSTTTVMSTTAVILFYGLFGGVGSCIVMAMTWNILHSNFSSPIQLNFPFSMGHVLPQLILPPIFEAVSPANNNLFILLGGLTLLIAPTFAYLNYAAPTKDDTQTEDNLGYYSTTNLDEESRYNKPPALQSFNVHLPDDVMVELRAKKPMDEDEDDEEELNWKNPGTGQTKEFSGIDYKLVTPEGVEVMEVIYEESEPESRYSQETIHDDDDPMDLRSLEQAYDEINRKYANLRTSRLPVKTLRKAQRWTEHTYFHAKGLAYQQVINPIKRATSLFKFYPSVFVKSVDVFTYILFINYVQRTDSPSTLLVAVSLPWLAICFAVLWLTESHLQNWQNRLPIIAQVIKFIGYYLLYATESQLALYAASVLIGAGQAVTFLILDSAICSLFSAKRWTYIRGSIYSCSGALILAYGFMAELCVPLMSSNDVYFYCLVMPHCLSSGFWIFYQMYYRMSEFYEDNLGLS